jgi:hypothetical protein
MSGLQFMLDGEIIDVDEYMARHPLMSHFRALHEINQIVNREEKHAKISSGGQTTTGDRLGGDLS